MAKLTDKQYNIICGAIGGVAVLLFGFLSYQDFGAIDEWKAKKAAMDIEITGAEAEKKAVPDLKLNLYVMREDYNTFKEILPGKPGVMEFYDTVDRFRKKHNIPEFDRISWIQNKLPAKKGQFIEDNYKGAFTASYEQVGQFINLVENFPRFFSLNTIALTTAGKVGEIKVELTINTYIYAGDTPLDEKVNTYLPANFKPDTKQVKQIREAMQEANKQGNPLPKDPFEWPTAAAEAAMRSPFTNPLTVEGPPVPSIPTETEKTATEEPIAPENNLVKIFANLEEIRNILYTLYLAGLIPQLEKRLTETDYEMLLKRVRIDPKVESAEKYQKKLEDFRKELAEWKKKIQEYGREEKARDLIRDAGKRLVAMEELYEQGKRESSEEKLRKVMTNHDQFLPALREFADFEGRLPNLQDVRKRMEELYKKSETQINMIVLSRRFKLDGIIYVEGNPQYCVAFISIAGTKIAAKVGSPLENGFVVDAIQEQRIILKYIGEGTVPLGMPQPAAGKPGKT